MHHHPPTLISQILPALFPVFLYMPVILGILSKTKSRIFCLRETGEGGGGAQNLDRLRFRKNARFCLMRKANIITNLKTILRFKGGGEAAILQLSREDKICAIFFLQEFLSGVCRSKFNRTSTNRLCYLNST